jgi:mannose-6-phosphate isomerase-like protein (cupin superfamily)
VPILHNDMNTRPVWCELESYAIISLLPGETHVWHARYKANKLVVIEGECRVDNQAVGSGGSIDLAEGDWVVSTARTATVVECGGHWGGDQGGAGVFTVSRTDGPGDKGDPANYPKHTAFDRHYHDCDEYWIIVSGSGTVSTEDHLYRVSAGDCVATRMGHHHDFPLVDGPVRGAFFETTMRGQRRRGHLWEHTHGPARSAANEGQ